MPVAGLNACDRGGHLLELSFNITLVSHCHSGVFSIVDSEISRPSVIGRGRACIVGKFVLERVSGGDFHGSGTVSGDTLKESVIVAYAYCALQQGAGECADIGGLAD